MTPKDAVEQAVEHLAAAGLAAPGTGAEPDPKVFLYVEGEDEFQQMADSFSSWLTGCVADEIAAARETGEA